PPRTGHRSAIARRQEHRREGGIWPLGRFPGGGSEARQTPKSRRKFTRRSKPANLGAMFKEALHGVVEGTEGGIAGLLMDFEGIPLESFTRAGASFDIEVVGAEVSVLVKAIQRA